MFLTSPAATLPREGHTESSEDALLLRARELHRQVPLVDGHNDLPWEIRVKAGGDLVRMDPEGPLPGQHTDIPRLREGGVGGVFWAAYVPPVLAGEPAVRFAVDQIGLIRGMTDRSQHLEMARTAGDVERIHRGGRVASLIGVEGGHAIANSLDVLRWFHELGVRYLTLTHADTIDWADAATDAPRHGGLTRFGEEVVREMNRLGMLVDLSHVSPEAMRAAIRVSEAPVVFSHSGVCGVADHPRNVPDDVLRSVKRNGGVVMINFYSGFADPRGAEVMHGMFDVQRCLRDENPHDPGRAHALFEEWRRANPVPRGTVATLADHVDHAVRVAGIDHVGLGSDFDGVTSVPVGMEDVSRYPHLTAELLRRGYAEDDVKKVLGGNVLRVMQEAERTAERLQRERPPSKATIAELDRR
ncbi:MAG TPA: dipeptidase [Longimicrobiaceae bacterium]|nr:dipeptidase [Longimicrobiaceae bacterium]